MLYVFFIDSTNPESTSIISEGSDLNKKDDHITISSEGPKTIKFLKPSDILSASGVKTVLNIPDIGKNSTHEVFIIADDGNATVIKGYNSISIKASTTIQ
uniref:IPT/TIG domain-containing protein n=1 Tax=Parastrongyloides trichosuri TaxID=131310 RepID=A0A0N4ZA09_PARTI